MNSPKSSKKMENHGNWEGETVPNVLEEDEGLIERIKRLEIEREKLLGEIKELKKMARSQVDALESEVSMLKEEARVFRELLRLS